MPSFIFGWPFFWDFGLLEAKKFHTAEWETPTKRLRHWPTEVVSSQWASDADEIGASCQGDLQYLRSGLHGQNHRSPWTWSAKLLCIVRWFSRLRLVPETSASCDFSMWGERGIKMGVTMRNSFFFPFFFLDTKNDPHLWGSLYKSIN